MKAPIALVTDSTADLPADLVAAHGIHVVPNLIMMDNQSLVDGKDITREEFYARLPIARTVSTATASSGVYEALYTHLLKAGAEHILSIHAASLLSGICNAASTAAQALGQAFARRIHIIDSQSVTLGLGFQVLAAAEAIEQGTGVEELLKRMVTLPNRARVIAMLDTLEFVRRSGRVSWARARLGNLLQIKPFIDVKNGVVHSLGETRTRRKGIERLYDLLLGMGAVDRLAIVHTNADAEAHEFLAGLRLDHPSPVRVVNATPVIGVHAGPGGLGFVVLLKE